MKDQVNERLSGLHGAKKDALKCLVALLYGDEEIHADKHTYIRQISDFVMKPDIRSLK